MWASTTAGRRHLRVLCRTLERKFRSITGENTNSAERGTVDPSLSSRLKIRSNMWSSSPDRESVRKIVRRTQATSPTTLRRAACRERTLPLFQGYDATAGGCVWGRCDCGRGTGDIWSASATGKQVFIGGPYKTRVFAADSGYGRAVSRRNVNRVFRITETHRNQRH